MQPGVVPGAVLEFHAAKAAGGLTPGINSPLTTQFFDTSGNANHGTLTNFTGTPASGYAGTGTIADPCRLVFDGAGYVACPDLGACEDGAFGYESWFIAPAATMAWFPLISEGLGDSAPVVYLSVNNGQLQVFVWGPDYATNTGIQGPALTEGMLYHAFLTCGASYLRLYLEGVEVGAPVTPLAPFNTTRTTVGLTYQSNVAGSGSIAIARIYSFEPVAEQVAQNYAAGPIWVPFENFVENRLWAMQVDLDAVKLKTETIPTSPAAVGSAMTLTSGERASIATSVWAATTRTLSGFGTLVADVWASAARALTDKSGFSGTATNMVAAAPIATANASAVRTNLTAELARIDENVSAAKTLTAGERTSIAAAVSGLATTGLAAIKSLLDAVKLKSDTIGTGSAIVQSPITASGTITVEQGDSYSASRGRPIDVNMDDPTHAKGLDAANVTVYLLATQFTWTAASVTETAGGYRVRFEPTIAETAAIRAGRQNYKLKACIDNVAPTDDDAETIQRGTVVMSQDIPAVP